ncbi:uncharacterized protein LOC106649298 [Trichogramma pretiosum]|uniref:uncharacterized protein LOC106649298 n=1 Tax=Trichogramma pretiosum TaxID=7493 RepID=UPI0006C9D072|nr:uncharacterized protein LOC106649298 [Trichogramma pretiosum]
MRFHIFLCMLIFLISAISINSAKKHQRHTTTIEPSLEEDEQPQRPMHMRPRPPMPHRPHHHRPRQKREAKDSQVLLGTCQVKVSSKPSIPKKPVTEKPNQAVNMTLMATQTPKQMMISISKFLHRFWFED